jgi:hypothetical protein
MAYFDLRRTFDSYPHTLNPNHAPNHESGMSAIGVQSYIMQLWIIVFKTPEKIKLTGSVRTIENFCLRPRGRGFKPRL